MRLFNRLERWLRQLVVGLAHWLGEALGDDGSGAQPSQPIQPPAATATPQVASPALGMGTAEPPLYRKSKSLLTDAERAFYNVLFEAVAGEFSVFAKVRMGDFVWLANEPLNRKTYSNQIQCKHVDFLLCDKSLQKPLLVLELDGPRHRKYDRRESDEFKDAAFRSIGLPIRRVPVRTSYSVPALRELIREAIRAAK